MNLEEKEKNKAILEAEKNIIDNAEEFFLKNKEELIYLILAKGVASQDIDDWLKKIKQDSTNFLLKNFKNKINQILLNQ